MKIVKIVARSQHTLKQTITLKRNSRSVGRARRIQKSVQVLGDKLSYRSFGADTSSMEEGMRRDLEGNDRIFHKSFIITLPLSSQRLHILN